MGRHVASRLGTTALLGHSHVHLAATDAHQRELRHDEEGVHQQKHQNQKQVDCGHHEGVYPFMSKLGRTRMARLNQK